MPIPIFALFLSLGGEVQQAFVAGHSAPIREKSGTVLLLPSDRTNDRTRKPEEPLTVRHLGRNEVGREVAESPHFRIIHNEKKPLVERIARNAEQLRSEISLRWFGDVSLEWDGKCSIYLHSNHKKYVKTTKQSNAMGHARTLVFGDQISARSIHLPCGLPNFFDDLLPHELTHAVLAVRFRGRLPRWANEGIAMLSESRASIDDRHESLREYRTRDELFSVEILMKTEDESLMNTLEYYAQSMSLVEFFVSQKGRRAFTKFLGDSLLVGYEPALKKHYGIAGYTDLERRWSSFAFARDRGPDGNGPNRDASDGPVQNGAPGLSVQPPTRQ